MVNPNDAADVDTGGNNLQNFPVITSTVIAGGNTIIAGSLNSEVSKTYRIEFYSNTSTDASGYGEGETYLGTTSVTTNGSGNASFSFTYVGVLSGRISATATEDLGAGVFGSTSEFALTTSTIYTLTGTVFEDKAGNLLVSEAIGDSNNPYVSGATVLLYADGGDGVATGTDDVLMTATTTNGSGAYSFSVDSGTYWVVVDSKTIASSVALNSGFTQSDTWSEQTYGSAGALQSSTVVSTVSGAAFGGRNIEASDNATSLSTAEHVTRAIVSTANVANIDSGFSFSIITRTGDGDHDGTNNRTVQGSLRQFVQNSNAIAGVQTSGFKLQTTDSMYNLAGNQAWSIRPTTALPTVTEGIVLDGLTQAGASANATTGQHNLKVILDGVSAPATTRGLNISNGDTTVRGFSIVRFGNTLSFPSAGIHITGPGGNVIETNFIGVDPSGVSGAGSYAGIDIESTTGTNLNRIGGSTIASRNVISKHAEGIYIHYYVTTPVVVQGNFIGTDWTGATALGNSYAGIDLEWVGGPGVTVGGLTAGEGNVISGNTGTGLMINGNGVATDNNVILGNLIGVAADGVTALGNSGPAIRFQASGNAASSASNNIIEANVIAASSVGIQITGNVDSNQFLSNKIGTDASGSVNLGNAGAGISLATAGGRNPDGNIIQSNLIRNNGGVGVAISAGANNRVTANSISGNSGLGIDLGTVGATANDVADADTGANNLQNFPVISSTVIAGGNTIIAGTLNSEASKTFRIEFFSNTSTDASGYGEGETYLGMTSITTNGSGNASFSFTFAGVLGGRISATATEDLGGGVFGSTSEFALTTSTIYTLTGTVFEDKAGNLLVSEAIGDSNNPYVSGATVLLYSDGGDGVATGTDDVLMTVTTTNGSGA